MTTQSLASEQVIHIAIHSGYRQFKVEEIDRAVRAPVWCPTQGEQDLIAYGLTGNRNFEYLDDNHGFVQFPPYFGFTIFHF